MSGRRRLARVLTLLFRLAVTALISVVVLRSLGLARIAGIASRAEPPWLAAAIALAALHIVAGAKRWQLLYGLLVQSPPRLWRMVHFSGQCLLFGQLLPSSIGSDVIRTGAIAVDGGLLAAARSVVCDRLVGLLLLLLIVAATLPLFVIAAGASAPLLSLAAVLVCGLAAFACLALAPRWFAWLPLLGRGLALGGADLRTALTARRTGPRVIALAATTHLIGIVLFAALLRSIRADIPLLDCLLVVPSALLVASVPISLGGWGVREAVIASGFAMLGGDPAAAATASILFGATAPLCGLGIELLAMLVGPGATCQTAK